MKTPGTRARTASAAALVVLLSLALSSCAFIVNAHDVEVPARRIREPEAPTNVILMIGDGMGTSHLTAAMIERGDLHMERLPVGGMMATFASNRLVTDSAAAGTAMATGYKSYNGAISVSPDGEPLKTVLEHAEDRGMATGLVTTCSVTHATPAVFASHIDSRSKQKEIARQMTSSGVDVLFGGGYSYFLPDDEPGGTRTDGLNLIEELRERMPVALTLEEFRALPEGRAAAALLHSGHPPTAPSRAPTLAALARKALSILSKNDTGFFLMVEGSQIDWAGHENDHDWMVEETVDFDDAVGVVMDFAEANGRTLVVVTADHETGAYSVLDGSLERHEVTRPNWGCGDHSAAMVPVLAYGPGADAFGGMIDNTHLGRVLIGFVSR